MNAPEAPPAPRGVVLPDPWQEELRLRLEAGEQPLAWLDLDLDARLQYAPGLVVLTDRRLLARAPGDPEWRDWTLRADQNLEHRDHAGVGTLEFSDGAGIAATWRYTLGRHPLTLRLVQRFGERRETL